MRLDHLIRTVKLASLSFNTKLSLKYFPVFIGNTKNLHSYHVELSYYNKSQCEPRLIHRKIENPQKHRKACQLTSRQHRTNYELQRFTAGVQIENKFMLLTRTARSFVCPPARLHIRASPLAFGKHVFCTFQQLPYSLCVLCVVRSEHLWLRFRSLMCMSVQMTWTATRDCYIAGSQKLHVIQ